jgi:hypothetical protein
LNIKSQKRETGMLDLTETSWVNVWNVQRPRQIV